MADGNMIRMAANAERVERNQVGDVLAGQKRKNMLGDIRLRPGLITLREDDLRAIKQA